MPLVVSDSFGELMLYLGLEYVQDVYQRVTCLKSNWTLAFEHYKLLPDKIKIAFLNYGFNQNQMKCGLNWKRARH